MAHFASFEAAIRYYTAEGFEISRCRCRQCGHNQVCVHWPVSHMIDTVDGWYLNLQCDACKTMLLEVIEPIHPSNGDH